MAPDKKHEAYDGPSQCVVRIATSRHKPFDCFAARVEDLRDPTPPDTINRTQTPPIGPTENLFECSWGVLVQTSSFTGLKGFTG